jgi:hypothetical protein
MPSSAVKRSRHERAAVLADALMDEGYDVEVTKYDVTDAVRVRVPGRRETMGLIAIWDDGRIGIMVGNLTNPDYPDEPPIRQVLEGMGLGPFIEAPHPETAKQMSLERNRRFGEMGRERRRSSPR